MLCLGRQTIFVRLEACPVVVILVQSPVLGWEVHLQGSAERGINRNIYGSSVPLRYDLIILQYVSKIFKNYSNHVDNPGVTSKEF